MIRDLDAEIHAYLGQHREATALEIARSLHARTIDILTTLRADTSRFQARERSDRRITYRLSRAVPYRSHSRRGPSHADLLAELLSDGDWHSHHELYAISCVAHSRIADLRRRGHVIEKRTVRGEDGRTDWQYRIVSSQGSGAGEPRQAAPQRPVRAGGVVRGASPAPEQLRIEAA